MSAFITPGCRMKPSVGIATGAVIVIAVCLLLMTPYYFIAPIIPLALAALIALYHYPQLGLLALVFLVPLEGLFAGNKFLTGSKLIGIALILVVGLRLLVGHSSIRNLATRQWYAILGLLGIFILSSQFSRYPAYSFEAIKDLLTATSIFLITLAIGDKLNMRHLMMTLSISVAITAIVSLFAPAPTVGSTRAVGLLADPNYFALLLVTAIPLNLYLALNGKLPVTRFFWSALIMLDLIALQKTLSRSGTLVLLMTLMTLGWHYRNVLSKLGPRHIGLFIAGSALGLVAVAVMIPDEFIQRILSLAKYSGVQSFEDPSLGRRTSYLVVGMELFRDSPLLGAGPGSFPMYYAQSGFASGFNEGMSALDIYRQAHNTYLEVLAETGLPGFVCYALLTFSGLAGFYRARRRALQNDQSAQASQIAHTGATFLAMAVFMLFLTATFHKYFWILLAVSQLAIRPYPVLSDKKRPIALM